jgi:hypothetical protein
MSHRFPVVWGNPPADHPPDREWPGPWLCVACSARLPRRAAFQCGECAHAWRWGWLLSLHDAWAYWQFIGPRERPDDRGWGAARAPWWRLDRLLTGLRIRRPGRVWVCPCCAHDL